MSNEEEDNVLIEKEFFDTESFISSIKSFPCVWNYKHETYSNKIEKNKAWATICEIFTQNFGEKSTKQKNEIAVKLQKKWKLLRDNFNRCEKRNKTTKSGSSASTLRPCAYYQQLLFLKDITQDKSERSSNFDTPSDKVTAVTQEERTNTKKIRMNTRKIQKSEDDELIETLTKKVKKIQQKEHYKDEDQMFLLSLCSDFKKIPENVKLDAKVDIISVIKKYTTQFMPVGPYQPLNDFRGYYTTNPAYNVVSMTNANSSEQEDRPQTAESLYSDIASPDNTTADSVISDVSGS